MSRLDRPALRGTLLGRLLRLWNPLMKRLLRSPLHWPWSRWFAVVEWTGRKSGRAYSTPVSCLVDDGRFLITTGDRWWKNLLGNAAVTMWVRGRRHEGVAEPVLGEDESVALHQRMFTVRPIFARLAGISRLDDGDQIRRSIRGGRTIIVIRPRAAPPPVPPGTDRSPHAG
jgi:deazaflavin-dependent oxidoreductase (nitroreductase family)